MELNILRQDVSLYNTVFEQSAEQSVDADFTLPDYYGEIAKILKCSAVPRIHTCGFSGQTLMLDGSVTVTVMYVSPDDEICSFSQIVPFSKSFELDGDVSGGIPECKAKCEFVNCRAITERKIEIHGAIGLYAKVVKKQCTQVVADIDGADMVLNRGVAPATSPIGMNEKCLVIDEELELSTSQPSIRNIIRYDAKAVNKDCKIISGKVVVKGEMCINVLYCAEQNNCPQTFKSAIPYSQIIDIDGINENCECSCRTEVAQLEIKPRTSASGETRSMLLNTKLRFCASASCNNDIPVVYDAYSTRYCADIKTGDITFEKICKTVSDSFVCKKNVELHSGEVGSVVDLWCDTQVGHSAVENDKLTVKGTVQICMLVYDSQNIPAYIERPIDFEYKCPLQECDPDMYCRPEVTANNCSYTITGAKNIEVSVELCVNAPIYRAARLPLVVDVTVDEDSVKQRQNDSALVIYYADKGERIWDIARRYNSSPEEISEINSVDTACLLAPKTLLIPIK